VLIKDDIEVRDSIVLQLANLNLQNQVVQFGTKNRAIVRGESGSAKIIGLEKGSLGAAFNWKEGLAFSAGNLGLEIPKAPLTDEILVNRGASALANDAMKAIQRWLWVRKTEATDKLPSAAKVRMYYQDYELNGLDESKLGFWALNTASNAWINCKVIARNINENWVEAENVPFPAYLSLGIGMMTTSSREAQAQAYQIKLRAFPNPSSDWVNVQFEVPEANQQLILECLDASGRLVFSEKVQARIGTYTLEKSLGNLSAGVYTLRLAGFPGVSTRLIKQ
jgi:Secretion system C-terminal sorting domain